MILDYTFEELRALETGANRVLASGADESSVGVAAPPEAVAHVAALQARLGEVIHIETLAEQRAAEQAVEAICREFRDHMDASILEYHPAHEESVAFYFDYAHAYAVLGRLREMGDEMSAIIELMTGEAPSEEAAREVTFGE